MDILAVFIENTDCEETILFKVNWGCIRTKILKENNIESFIKMKKLFNKENITLIFMEQQVLELQMRISQQTEEINKIEDEIKIMNFKIKYLEDAYDQEIVLQLMDFGIDAEQEKWDKEEIIKANKKSLKELSRKRELKKKHEKKINKIRIVMSSYRNLIY